MMTLDDCRLFFSEEVCLAANIRSPALVDAFARVPREKFLGAGPWRTATPDMGMGAAYRMTDDADPRHIYHNVSVALDPGRDLINGQPGTLARWMDELDIRAGDRIFHLGAGVGYYTAILAEVAGAGGRVVASEVDADLAARARANLAGYANVEVHSGDGAAFDPGECDAVLINAGVTHPHALWLDRLREGGRMVLPLTVAMGATLGKGVVAKITREGSGFSARVVTFVVVYSCTGARDPQREPLLGKAMAAGTLMKMKSVRRDAHERTETCILHGSDVCLSAAETFSAAQTAS
jgi:protein-L-isoaspartate(D-aspartate) O-methyltransferase